MPWESAGVGARRAGRVLQGLEPLVRRGEGVVTAGVRGGLGVGSALRRAAGEPPWEKRPDWVWRSGADWPGGSAAAAGGSGGSGMNQRRGLEGGAGEDSD